MAKLKKKEQKKEHPDEKAEAPKPKVDLKEEDNKATKSGEWTAIVDINPTYRKGMVVPETQVDHWKNKNGFNIEEMVERS